MPQPPDAPDSPAPPPVLERLAPGGDATLAYRLVPGVTTWRLTSPGGAVRFAKVDTEGRFPTLRAECERMVWAAPYLPVPTVVTLDRDGGTTTLLTEALPGHDGTDPVRRNDVGALVAALGRGLRAFHEAVGEEWCPFRFDMARALDHVARRVAADDVDPAGFHDEHRHLSPAGALAELAATAPVGEDLVVCHGDYCPPNVLLCDGVVTGYVDLGELGVADRWWDVAVGGWSTCWNFGEQFEPTFYEGYGITPDPERIRFFRLLYDLVS
ncbi:MAG: aminoglycoside 3'-phosphotransferase [Acidimicrobiales bacterium]|jgi:kanamycin kinase